MWAYEELNLLNKVNKEPSMWAYEELNLLNKVNKEPRMWIVCGHMRNLIC